MGKVTDEMRKKLWRIDQYAWSKDATYRLAYDEIKTDSKECGRDWKAWKKMYKRTCKRLDVRVVDYELIANQYRTLLEETLLELRFQEDKTGDDEYATWLVDPAMNGWMDWRCSHCGWTMNHDIHVDAWRNKCPNCGKSMVG